MFKSPAELREEKRVREIFDRELANERAAGDELLDELPLWRQLGRALRAVMPRRWDAR